MHCSGMRAFLSTATTTMHCARKISAESSHQAYDSVKCTRKMQQQPRIRRHQDVGGSKCADAETVCGARMRSRGSIVAAQLDPDNADPVIKGYFDTANKKLNMPGIPGGQYP